MLSLHSRAKLRTVIRTAASHLGFARRGDNSNLHTSRTPNATASIRCCPLVHFKMRGLPRHRLDFDSNVKMDLNLGPPPNACTSLPATRARNLSAIQHPIRLLLRVWNWNRELLTWTPLFAWGWSI